MRAVFFPNQWFDTPHVRKLVKEFDITTIIIWEDPACFGIRKGDSYPSKIPLNSLRIAYQYAGDRIFAERLQTAFPNVTITVVGMTEASRIKTFLDPVVFYDPCDTLLVKKFPNARIVDSPQFVLTASECIEYATGRKRLMHHHFFDVVKHKIKFLENVKSTDLNNRKAWPAHAQPPPSPFVEAPKADKADKTAAIWLEAVDFVKKEFPNNPGPVGVSYATRIPITPTQARAWLKKFLVERLDDFGTYQDAIVSGEQWLNHSGISVMLNNGLLVPNDVLRLLRPLEKKETGLRVGSIEAFTRQVFGWREYARMYYLTTPPTLARLNVLGNSKKLEKYWWGATGATGPQTGAAPPIVHEAIDDAWNTGYLHHIRRLMVIANYMNLTGVHPDEMYRWMFAFALDAWPWVMVFNVYSMGSWSDGGHAMRKPYVSSSSYISKMARPVITDPWKSEWDALYKQFLHKHREALKHTILAVGSKN